MWGVKPTELEDEAGDDELSHDSEEEEEELRDCETLYLGRQTFKIQEFWGTHDNGLFLHVVYPHVFGQDIERGFRFQVRAREAEAQLNTTTTTTMSNVMTFWQWHGAAYVFLQTVLVGSLHVCNNKIPVALASSTTAASDGEIGFETGNEFILHSFWESSYSYRGNVEYFHFRSCILLSHTALQYCMQALSAAEWAS